VLIFIFENLVSESYLSYAIQTVEVAIGDEFCFDGVVVEVDVCLRFADD
jgi:hypothetical protein